MAVHFYHPDLRNKIETLVTRCDMCQKQKQQARHYGEVPPRETSAYPWREVAVKNIEPWTLEVDGQKNRVPYSHHDQYGNKSGQTKKT